MRRACLLVLSSIIVCATAHAQLTATDVQRIINQAAKRANKMALASVIAVTDREGYVIGVWDTRGVEPNDVEISVAVGKAGTAAYLSSNAEAFTSRTAAFIIQQHFPPGVKYQPPGPLVGVGFSNLPFSDVNRFKKPDGIATSTSPGTLGSPIPFASLNGIPGGLPLYKNGSLVGGVGVSGAPINVPSLLVTGVAFTPSGQEFPPTAFLGDYSKDEDIAITGQKGFEPSPDILATNVFINGISLPYVASSGGSTSGTAVTGKASSQYPVIATPPPFPYPTATFSGVQGQIRQPIISDPLLGTINGQPRLTSSEVAQIIAVAADRVRTTRAGIRLPIGSRAEVWITVENNPNAPGVGPTVLGAFRTGDATLFSWDVAVQKGRTAVGFSNDVMAFSTRTVGFLAQSHFPPGIDPEGPGPYNGKQEAFSGFDPTKFPKLIPLLTVPAALVAPFVAPNPRYPNGITIFPGGFPLYRNGVLIGAVGISGDGVDQDDIIGASGSSVFLAPLAIEADKFSFDDTRLPYAKFPRDPEAVTNVAPVTIAALAEHAAPAAKPTELANISARLDVQGGERLMIGGFIIDGDNAKRIVVRALGPSLASAGIANPLSNPAIALRDTSGATIASNLNWRDSQAQADELTNLGLAPTNDKEAALVQALDPGAYTALMTGEDGGTGIGVIEIYDVDPGVTAQLTNLSTRGYVGPGDEVLIGGFILRGSPRSTTVIVRGIGPSLAQKGITEPLANPTVEIRDSNGELAAANDDWRDTQQEQITDSGLAPTNNLESAAIVDLGTGAYTAVLRGKNDSAGIALIEVYKLPQ